MTVEAPTPLARYHRVLEAVLAEPSGLPLGGIARRVELPRSSAHRIAAALCAIGYLELDPEHGAYTVGPVFENLVRRSLLVDRALVAFRPALEYLVAKLDETAFLGRRLDHQIEIASVMTPGAGERSYIYPGTGPRPLDKCSSSKAILAWLPPEQIRDIFEANGLCELSTLGHSLEDFTAMLQRVREQGFAVCDGEIDEGICSYAVPVQYGRITGLHSLGIVGPVARLKSHPQGSLVEALKQAARIATSSLLMKTGKDRNGSMKQP